jgi:hypothetical protein
LFGFFVKPDSIDEVPVNEKPSGKAAGSEFLEPMELASEGKRAFAFTQKRA